jgi:hypothetical protein
MRYPIGSGGSELPSILEARDAVSTIAAFLMLHADTTTVALAMRTAYHRNLIEALKKAIAEADQ